MRNNDLSWGTFCFFTGTAVGAVTALLLAPQSGPRTRRMIRRKAEDGREYVEDVGEELMEKGREVFERGRKLVDQNLHGLTGR